VETSKRERDRYKCQAWKKAVGGGDRDEMDCDSVKFHFRTRDVRGAAETVGAQ